MLHRDLKSKYLSHPVQLDRLEVNRDYFKPTYKDPADDLFVVDTIPHESKPSPTAPSFSRKGAKKKEKPIDLYSTTIQVGQELRGYLSYSDSPEIIKMRLDALTLGSEGKRFEKDMVIKPGIEKEHSLTPYRQSKRQQKKQNKAAREATAGTKWFNLPAPEMTEEAKRDLEVIKMRNVLDPSRFYKKSDYKNRGLPKYFVTGTVVETAADFYSGRIPKKDRKRTLVEELMADAQFTQYAKRKHTEALLGNPGYNRKQRKAENLRRKERQEMHGGKSKYRNDKLPIERNDSTNSKSAKLKQRKQKT